MSLKRSGMAKLGIAHSHAGRGNAESRTDSGDGRRGRPGDGDVLDCPACKTLKRGKLLNHPEIGGNSGDDSGRRGPSERAVAKAFPTNGLRVCAHLALR